jgi:hypothetical protein
MEFLINQRWNSWKVKDGIPEKLREIFRGGNRQELRELLQR